MYKFKLLLAAILVWLVSDMLHAAVWQPTWTENTVRDHVSYTDNSTNCIPQSPDFPIFLYCSTNNDFGYYMYDGKNTSDNKGNVNVEYFLLDLNSATL